MNRLGAPPYICLITPGESNTDNYPDQKDRILRTVREAARDGVHLIQLREKNLSTRLLTDLVAELNDAVSGTDTAILVNDRTDVALATNAAGVHLPEAGLPASAVREAFGKILIGASAHSLAAAEAAARNGADFLLFGPVFDTPGKGPAVGVESLAQVCHRLTGFPVLALGGIDEANCVHAIEAGAAGIAAIRALNDSSTRRKIVAKLRRLDGLR